MKITFEENKFLKLLAVKADPNNFNWWEIYREARSSIGGYRCCICRQLIVLDTISDSAEAMINHAISHIKESNLAPFL